MASKNNTIKEAGDTKLVGMGLPVSAPSVQNALYTILVMLGILGNATVFVVIGKSVIMDRGGGRTSDIIIINMTLSNLLVSLMRNTLLVISDMGVKIYLSKGWCQYFMGFWVWLRSVNVWSTLFLSAFHFRTLRRVAPTIACQGIPKTLLLSLALIWFLNFIYSIPAHIFSTNGGINTTETLMLVSSTTRPLLGCVWKFPSSAHGLAYATTSIIINEAIPIILMVFTNLGSFFTLYTYGRTQSSGKDAPLIKRVPAERRAAKVILALIMLFIASWGTSVISVNYFNYSRGSSVEFLLVIARFSNTTFIAMSPVFLAVGHRRLRAFIKSLLSH
ncbi:olfactory receptor class A-like protein 4 [Sander lucioperca]|uniref:olfactory receptor class A-like protein 4 n=1 Tax=Sander lucioperca TaxID=283035 RepID=UPI00125DE9C8|nr:olfactory receptor class A-like protein 4 [Sander lucioperca]